MPKKTKKDKILARIRRTSESRVVSSESIEPSVLSSSPYTFIKTSDRKMQQAVSEYAIELKTIKSDLYKTIFLAILAFSVELYVYWLLQH